MGQYRCYFFGSATAIVDAEEIEAESDAMARALAESLYLRQHNRGHGFELWQSARMVHRLRPRAEG